MNNATHLTPADVELVTAADVVVGDTLVNFTPTGKNVMIPPTDAQLRRLRADRTLIVDAIASVRPGIVDLGTGPDRATYTVGASVWRVIR